MYIRYAMVLGTDFGVIEVISHLIRFVSVIVLCVSLFTVGESS